MIEYFEAEVGWAHFIYACEQTKAKNTPAWLVNPYNAIVPVWCEFNVVACRDWLHSAHVSFPYKMMGYYDFGTILPRAVRFQLSNYEDYLIFMLRWI